MNNRFEIRYVCYSKIFLAIVLLLGVMSCSKSSLRVTAKKVAESKEEIKPRINVFLENSGSMDGYVNGQTQFKDIVYSYIDELQTNCASSVSLNYINSNILPASSNDVRDFVKNLTPQSFSQRGGERGTSDIAQVIEQVLSHTPKGTLSVLISDCILSPGAGKDASDYQNQQRIAIRSCFDRYKKKIDNLSVVVYQLYSDFKGTYYNSQDAPTKISHSRPYYIWLIGEGRLFHDVLRQAASPDIDDKDVNTFAAHIFSPVCFKVSNNGQDNPQSIHVSNGIYRFGVKADMRATMMDNTFLTDAAHYQLSNSNYSIKSIVPNQGGDKDEFTHIVTLEVSRPSTETLSLKVLNVMPAWVDEANDDKGTDINSKAMNKTFGIKYILGGVYDAYKKIDCLADFQLEIKY